MDHPAMARINREDEESSFQYCCPIARRDIWPPADYEESDGTVWDSLEPSPERFAEFHCFSPEDITLKLKLFETSIYSILIPEAELEEFKNSVWRITEAERLSWTFKRSLIRIDQDTIDDLDISEMDPDMMGIESGGEWFTSL